MSPAPTLLVASGGGHLEQLLQLLPVLAQGEDRVWVSYDAPQSRSLLQGEHFIAAHHPTTKNVPNAMRNYRLARRVFADVAPRRVISTGAAVAVPFLLRGSQVGVPCHYIESATRAAGPSLSGRMLERVRGVTLYRQLGDWGSDRWSTGPSVFAGFTTSASSAVREPPLKVVVSLGTHRYGFGALVECLAQLLPHRAEVTWQLGSTSPPTGLRGRVARTLPAHELAAEIGAADLVVGHAGVGLALTALKAGKVPVLVPRRRSRGEHTDDHQVQLSQVLGHEGLAVTAELEQLSREHLVRALNLEARYRPPPPFTLL